MLRDTNSQKETSLNIEQASQILQQDRSLKLVKPMFDVPKDVSQDLKAALTAF